MERSPINDFELGVLVLQDGRHSACRNLPEVKEYSFGEGNEIWMLVAKKLVEEVETDSG